MGQNISVSVIGCGNLVGQQLVSAIREGDLGLVQRMVDGDPKLLNGCLFYDRQTPLHLAAAHGQLEVLSMLLERGALPNALNRSGQTPLMLACKSGRGTCIEHLLKAGANVLGFDFSYGRTCLHYACRGGHADCVLKILDTSRSGPVSHSWGLARFVNVRDCRGQTALHMASRMGHASVVLLLLDNGALVSSTTTTLGNGPDHGSSPIHCAARGGSVECVRELLAWGADRNQRDVTGYTPFGIAMKYSNTACAAILNPHAAEPLVWPSPWKFMSEGELEPEAKSVLQAALAQANSEIDKEIAIQASQEEAKKSSARKSSARRNSSLASFLAMPSEQQRTADTAVLGETPSPPLTEEPRISAVGGEFLAGNETPTEEAHRISMVGDLPGGDFSTVGPDAVDMGGIGVQEVCCICFEQFCTIEVMECGHQMCATCTLSLCCHSKPNPAIPYSPPPSCPFCRHSIGHLILARPKPKPAETPEKKFKRKLKRSGSKNSKGGSGGFGSFTGSILSALGGSKRHGASGRIADADWLDRCGSITLGGSIRHGSSGRIPDADFLERCGSIKLGNSGRVGDGVLERCSSKSKQHLGASGKVACSADGEWLERSGSRGGASFRFADPLDRF
ncbi:unnamed protein product [Calypogeia fissa]